MIALTVIALWIAAALYLDQLLIESRHQKIAMILQTCGQAVQLVFEIGELVNNSLHSHGYALDQISVDRYLIFRLDFRAQNAASKRSPDPSIFPICQHI